jgi:pimeloyl-ACP methyl ester carboxylesterase
MDQEQRRRPSLGRMGELLLLIALSAAAGAAGPAPLLGQKPDPGPIPERPFERPDGPYPVGTIDTLWVDLTRAETLSRDPADHRRVMIQIWYPAQAETGATAPYIRRREEFGGFAGYDSLLHVRTNSFAGAPLARSPSRFPVLLYSHGGSWSRFTGTFVTEWLASHGYGVVAIDHNGFNKSVLFPDGYRLVHDTLTFPVPRNQDRRADALASWDFLDQVMFPLWVGDATFALDQIEKLDRESAGRFRGRLDLDRIGMFGFSFGGAAAMEMAVRDPRIKAAIDQDGQLFGRARDSGTSRPVMLMHHQSEPPPDTTSTGRGLSAMVRGWTETFTARSTGPVNQVTIARAHHGHFSDLSLLMYRDVFTDSVWIDARRAHRIINAYTLAFFDRYLKNRPSELLDGRSSPFPEATMERKSGKPATKVRAARVSR